MAQRAKCLSHKQEGLSLNPQHQWKISCTAVQVCISPTLGRERQKETGGSVGLLSSQSSPIGSVRDESQNQDGEELNSSITLTKVNCQARGRETHSNNLACFRNRTLAQRWELAYLFCPGQAVHTTIIQSHQTERKCHQRRDSRLDIVATRCTGQSLTFSSNSRTGFTLLKQYYKLGRNGKGFQILKRCYSGILPSFNP